MITGAEVRKLAAIHAAEPALLSLYLAVQLDPAQLRELPARARGLLARPAGPAGQLRDADREQVLAKVAMLGRDWLGHGVAIFSCDSIGLFEVYRLPDDPPERAVVGVRPHIRPLLAAVQRHPAYRVAVVDRRHAWVLAIDGDDISTVAASDATTVPSPDFGGWYGLDAYRVHERVIELARHHYHATAGILAQLARQGEQPLVIGGHRDGIRQLLGSLPPRARDAFAGSFAADTHALTPARVRELAGPVVTRWAESRAQRLAAEIARMPSSRAATGLEACLAAVNADAAEVLVAPDDGLVAGYVCGRCGALGIDADECQDWGTAAMPVPDLIEEMITRTLEEGGQVIIARDAPSPAARLRFPLTHS
jgi:hypothetical protein